MSDTMYEIDHMYYSMSDTMRETDHMYYSMQDTMHEMDHMYYSMWDTMQVLQLHSTQTLAAFTHQSSINQHILNSSLIKHTFYVILYVCEYKIPSQDQFKCVGNFR